MVCSTFAGPSPKAIVDAHSESSYNVSIGLTLEKFLGWNWPTGSSKVHANNHRQGSIVEWTPQYLCLLTTSISSDIYSRMSDFPFEVPVERNETTDEYSSS
jgi:hypothetical protein